MTGKSSLAKRVSPFCLVFVLAVPAFGDVLLYPTALETGRNMLVPDKWRVPSASAGRAGTRTWTKTRGGPFGADEPAWSTSASVPQSSCWSQSVKVEKGRRYLVGAWTRQANTRVLLWIWGRKENGKPLNERLYLFGGYNTCLEPYLRAETKAKLSGEPNSWKLMYRPLDIDSDLRGGTVQVKIGIYMSTGAMTFSHPFMIDITDLQDKTLTVDVSGDKPISRLALSRLGLRDVIWEKRFDAPRKSYREAIRFSDCLRGFDGDPMRPVSGHSLFATYQDGMSQSVTAPQEHSVRVR